MSPRVSVVVPVHNGMPHLPVTLDAVLGQTLPPDEVIVVENGSTDGTAEWLAEHAPAGVRVVVQDELVGPGANWTTATAAATGDYVKLVCADDLLEPRALEIQVAQLEAHPFAVLAAASRVIVDDAGRVVLPARGIGRLKGEVDGREAVRACVLAGGNPLGEPAAVLFRGDALRADLPWDDTHGYVIDVDMYSRVLQRGTLVTNAQPLARFRLAAGSWSSVLAGRQRQHIEAWVDGVRARDLARLSSIDVLRSRVSARLQEAARAVVYRVIASKLWARRSR